MKTEMIEKVEGLGGDDFVEWWAGEYDKALAEASNYLE